MKINEIKNELLDEKCYHIVHPTGLNIYIMPKPGYSEDPAEPQDILNVMPLSPDHFSVVFSKALIS
jgi:hypothetical protein